MKYPVFVCILQSLEAALCQNRNYWKKIHALDDTARNEVADFIDFLLTKKSDNQTEKHPKAGFLRGHSIVMKAGFDAIPDDFAEYTG